MRSDIIYGGIGWKELSTPAGCFEALFNVISLMFEIQLFNTYIISKKI
jgi:hypothetical protein